MFNTIFKYEIGYWLKQPTTYLYAFIFLSLSILYMMGSLGAFGSDTVSGTVFLENSPKKINVAIGYFTLFVLFLLPTIIGNSINRDYTSNMHSILYSYPFTKRDYLLAKFMSSFLIVMGIVLMIGIGLFIGTQMPGIQVERLAPFNFMAYLQTYLIYVIPNIFLYGAIVFAVVTFSRNVYAGFIVVGLLMFIPQLIKSIISDGIALSILDPFGDIAVQYYTRYWTITEQNESLLPIEGVIIYNRLLWLAMASLIFAWMYRTFSFSQNVFSFSFKKNKANREVKNNFGSITKLGLSKVKYVFSTFQHLKTCWRLSNIDFISIVKSWPFITILLGGLVVVFFMLVQMNPQFENEILPVTWLMLSFPVLFFSLVITFLTFLYSGVLIHRSSNVSMNHLIDATPLPNWVMMLSKFIAIVKMQIVLLSLIMIAGIATQIFKGYYNFEIGHYIFELLVLNLIVYVIWAFAAFFIHTLFNQLYVGLFALLIGYIGIGLMPDVGFDNPLFIFNSGNNKSLIDYTDMNGYGSSLPAYFIYKSYWTISGVILLTGSLLFWIRGLDKSFKERFILLRKRFKGTTRTVFISSVILFISAGAAIHYETAIRNPTITSEKELNNLYKIYEKKYGQYDQMIQPRITSMTIKMDIYPEEQSFAATGNYYLANKSNQPIDTLLIRTGFDERTAFDLNKSFTLLDYDSSFKFSVLRLANSLMPMDSLNLTFSIANEPNTLFQVNSNVLENGTFIGHDAFPRLGYHSKDKFQNPSDSSSLTNSYQSKDSDLIRFESIVSTSEDQIAISPGYLQKEWAEGNRRFFSYSMNEKIKTNFSFNSARYEVVSDTWNDVSLEIYYYKSHDYNLESMMKGLKASLDYNTKYFSPYQHKQARIIEFPVTRGSFATVFANSIPFSEVRFIADINPEKENSIDLPFYVAAHEVAHLWWGGQVIPANTLGARLLTESFAEYVSLKTLRNEYGDTKAQKYLDRYIDQYIKKRNRDTDVERPLMSTEGKRHISYVKGSLVLNAFSHYLGEDIFNRALSEYIQKVKFQGPPYTTSIELLNYIEKATPDSLKYLINDMFETVTLYENNIINASTSSLKNGKFKVDLEFTMSKFRNEDKTKRDFGLQAKSLLYEQEESDKIIQSLPLNEYINIVLFDENKIPIYSEEHNVREIYNSISIVIDQKPFEVGLDPFNYLINTNFINNRKKL